MFSLLDFCFCPKTSGLWSSSPTAEGEGSIDAPSLMQQTQRLRAAHPWLNSPGSPEALGLPPASSPMKWMGPRPLWFPVTESRMLSLLLKGLAQQTTWRRPAPGPALRTRAIH